MLGMDPQTVMMAAAVAAAAVEHLEEQVGEQVQIMQIGRAHV